ncbi:cyclic nucleotide-binding domain-containing protein [Phosphitispora sp. TUW77]|uniref:cyclic nucleotide-binding domain-containing protein n=1 Tax=Phosphitispora sp. TUW77 TaxID=3152361 RepID=UPI003AB7CF61
MDWSKERYLSSMGLFSELNNQEIKQLADNFHWVTYQPGADIIEHGQTKHFFFILIKGSVDILMPRKGKGLVPAGSFLAGDFFGEISLFTGKPAPYIVRAAEECRLLVLDSEHFAYMLLRWPILYRKFLEKLSKRLNQVNSGLWEAKHKEFLRSGLQINQFEHKFYGLWGSPRTTRAIENKINELSIDKEHLLLIGERGTGRQMFGWYLHNRQFTEDAPFIVVNARQFDQQWGDLMFETHDHEGKQVGFVGSGLLDLAEGGTLFIRNINMISPRAQLQLAKALDAGEANCRIIGNLLDEPERLEQRLIPQLRKHFTHKYVITPLRVRKRDIPIIAMGILEKLALKHNRNTPVLSPEAIKLLLSHHYRQGNVTELIRIIERAFFLAEDDHIGIEHVFIGPVAEKTSWSIDMMKWPWVSWLVRRGIYPGWVQYMVTVAFIIIVALLFIAPDVKAAGLLFVVVWGFWWPSLTIISPTLGRVWCSICPFSCIMERFQKLVQKNRSAPDFLKKYDYLLITIGFLMVFWVEAITDMRSSPLFTGLWLVVITAAASITGMLYSRHTWCRHLCPLGGFVGVASVGGMLEVRSDANVCLNKCTSFECYHGTATLSGCPLSMHVPYVDNNIDCKLCLHCVRNCPNDAVQFNLRLPGREIWHLVRVNQGFAVFIGVALLMLIPIHYFEPLRQSWPLDKWRLWFSAAFWGTAVVAGIAAWLIARPFRSKLASRRIKLVFAFIPLVLSGYIMYQLHFIPGISNFRFGLMYTAAGVTELQRFVPALEVGRIIAALFGIMLSSFTVIMVMVSHLRKSAEISDAKTQSADD